MDVSVILINYNTRDVLSNAIDSVINQTILIEYEIIVVDNNSTDNPGDFLERKYGNMIKFLPLSMNFGFGRACNEGVKISKGRNLFFLNPDTVLLSNAIKILSEFLDKHPETGIGGGNLFSENMAPAYSYRRFLPSLFWELNDLFLTFPEKIIFRKSAHFNYSSKTLNVAYITGADLMIPRIIFERVGCFDPDYFLYFEESDLANRVRKSGYLIKSVPQARVAHFEGASFDNIFSRNIHYFTGKLLYYKKNTSAFSLFLIRTTILLTFHTRISAFFILNNKQKIQYWRGALNAFRIAESKL